MRLLPPELNGGIPPAEAHATLTRILDAIDEYVYTGEFLPDGAYRLIFAGPCRERFLGLTRENSLSAIWADYVHPDDMDSFREAHHAGMASGWIDVEYRLIGADGVLRWVRDRGRMRREGGRGFLDGSILDVTEMRSAQQALEAARAEAQRLSTVDPLTGVANRRTLPARLCAARAASAGILLLDVDRFKDVNDGHGHGAGDAVLVEIAARLRERVRGADEIVRMGGEEFLAVLEEVPDAATLRLRAEAVRAAMEQPVELGEGLSIAVTVSIGGALAAEHDDADALLGEVDRSLYEAKRQGRNRVVVGCASAVS